MLILVLHEIQALLLSDYELGENLTGLDCIKLLTSPSRSILVTARSEEPEMISSAKTTGVQILPKALARVIPVERREEWKNDVVLIDDDELVHMSWKRRLAKSGTRTHTFFSVDCFLKECPSYPVETPIYIDSNLGEGLKGEILSENIAKKGYKSLFITTGYDPSSISKPPWITSIKNKAPPL